MLSEFEKFDTVVRKVLSVSHNELQKREKKYQRQRTKKKAGMRKMQGTYELSVVFDQTIVAEKLTELREVLRIRFPKGTPKKIINDISGLVSNVLVSYHDTAASADSAEKIVIRLDLGGGFEHLLATLRTGKVDIHDYCTSLRG